jgi:alanine racemase
VTQPIVLLEGVFMREQLLEAARHGFDLVVHDPLQIELLEEFEGSHRFVLWLKVDTGMNRLGFRASGFPAALERLRRLQPAPLELRILTHLARADDRDDSATAEQLAQFESLTGSLPYATSIPNSAGIFGGIATKCDWIRPGIALYGVSPFADQTGVELGLQPVMALRSTVIATRIVARGETIGYGGTWKAARDTTVAIVAAGYGDGVPRSLPNGTPVLIDGHRAPLAGRVSMDMIAVDLSELGPVDVGTPVTLWGSRLPVEEIARHAGTIPHELLCGVSQRVPIELG